MSSVWTQRLLAGAMSLLIGSNVCYAQNGTIWNFLGIPKGVNKVKDASLNRRGNRPGLERKPPLKALSDPSFLAPEIAEGIPTPKPLMEAAKVKIQEDLAPQKIKAVKFLAKMGCGCYNDDGGIVDALAEALVDCTDDVRLATIKALMDVAKGETCAACKTKSCCDEKLLLLLAEIAYHRDETGCYKEKNEEIREAAANALETCCPNPEPPIFEAEEEDDPEVEAPEVPDPETPETPEGGLDGGDAAEGDTVTRRAPIIHRDTHAARRLEPRRLEENHTTPRRIETRPAIIRRRPSADHNPETVEFTNAVLGNRLRQQSTEVSHRSVARDAVPRELDAPQPPSHAARSIPVFPTSAKVSEVDVRRQAARIEFGATSSVPTGSKLEIIHRYFLGKKSVGQFEVVRANASGAWVRPVGRSRISSVARGDEVRFME